MSAFLTLASVINSSRGNHSSNLPPGNPAPFSNATFSLPATMTPNAVPQSHAHTMPSPQYPALTHSPAPAPFHLSSSPSSTFFALNLIFFSSPFRPRSATPFPTAPDSAPGTRPTKGAMSPVTARIPLHALPFASRKKSTVSTARHSATSLPSTPPTSSTASAVRSANRVSRAATSLPKCRASRGNSSCGLAFTCPPFRPVAPAHSARASSTTTFGPSPASSASVAAAANNPLATATPVMPLPITTTSASRASVSDCIPTSSGNGGSSSQYGLEGLSCGMPGAALTLASSA
ncbi:hypothetical protein CH63R_10830 [Colletotrichum higginsianum IMI 349063]|uniref:Uncharacterized protein n=1 Tax=Colletotrichum higginsianum (strain IMI 349063) TaxID=759273 RepID=A0A1B7Y3W5_COLHI|nr:uncharacterized protein CH63R_10830 [Colletotrichum higginsianum IMI 349063]OBR06710.1 hypothetical protein CH63R_10830 [Colletotrichum higginsianum IMI 349063]